MKTLFFTIAMGLGSVLSAQLDNGLTAHYSFNGGNADDEVGNVDGVVHGAALSTDRFGNANAAYTFVDSQYIALPSAASLTQATMSISLWIKVNGYNAGANNQNFIYSVINSSTAAYFGAVAMCVVNNGSYLGVSQNGPTESSYGYSSTLNDSSWQHFVLTLDNDSLKMYIDNQQQWSYAKPFTTNFTSDSIYIGASGNSTYQGFFNGQIDDIRVYNRVLSAADVDSLYNEPAPTITTIQNAPSQNNLANIYPNPAQNSLFFELGSNPTAARIEILDLQGRCLQTAVAENTSRFTLPLAVPAGMYFARITNEQNQQTLKFIKE